MGEAGKNMNSTGDGPLFAEGGAAQPRPELFILCALLFAFCYFFHPALYDNALSRLDLTYSLALEHTASIDAYHANTMDKAFHNGHYYCDKAPGLSFAAVPVLALANRIFHFRAPDPGNPLQAYLLTLFTVALPCALSFVLLFRILKYLTGSGAPATLITLATALGTICFTYSTQFYGHLFSAALEIGALYLLMAPIIYKKRTSTQALVLAGFLLGFAVISDYPSAIPAAFIGVFAFTAVRPVKRAALVAAGAALPVLALAYYNTSIFGSPLAIGYFKEVSPYYSAGMSKGLGGVTAPDAAVFFKLLFSPERGLFWGSPFLLMSVPAIYVCFSLRGAARTISLGAAGAFLSILALNSAYYEPYGGFSPGPRFLAGAIPFLAMPIAAAWRRFATPVKFAFAALCGVSVILNVIVNAVEPHVPHIFTSPVLQFSIPLHRQGFMYDNLGTSLFRLNGHASFLPLAVAVLISAAYFKLRFVNRNAGFKNVLIGLFVFVLTIFVFAETGTRMGAPAGARYYISETWLRQGLVNFKSQKYDTAEASFKKAIAADPSQAQPYISLSALYLMTGNRAKALPILISARKLGYNKSVERLMDAALGKDGGKRR